MHVALPILAFIAAAATPEPPVPSLTLPEAVRRAQSASEDAEAARLQLDAAAARVAAARAAFFPSLTVTGLYAYRPWETTTMREGKPVILRAHHGLSGTAAVTLNLLDPRVFPLYRQAALERDAAALSRDERLRHLGFTAAEAFLLGLGAEAVEGAALARVAVARDSLTAAVERQRAGLVGANDVTRAELEVASAERELAGARGNVVQARHNLEYMVNAAVGTLVPPEDLLVLAAGDAALAPASGTRLDVEAAQRRAEAAAAGADEPWLRYLPSLAFTSEWSLTNEAGLASRDYDGFLGARLNWRLFDGGVGLAQAAERDAQAGMALAEARGTARRAALEARTAAAFFERSRAEARESEAALAVARRNTDETGALYRQGLATVLALADASQRLFEAEVARARARFGAAMALLELWAALGLNPEGRAAAPTTEAP